MNALIPLLILLVSPTATQSQPFPTKSVKVNQESCSFSVVGKQALPRNAKVSILRYGEIQGTPAVGANGEKEEAVIEVSGVLELKAVTGGKLKLKNVWIELTPECRSLHLNNVHFVDGGGIRASEQGPSTADVFMQKVYFYDPGSLSLACQSGTVTVSSVTCYGPAKLMGAARSKKAKSTSKIRVIESRLEGLEVSGAKQALVQSCHLGGETSRFADNGKLILADNSIRSRNVELAHSKAGQFKKATITRCDFLSKEIRLQAPPNDGKIEKFGISRCYFKTGTDAAKVLASQIRDASRTDETSVRVSLTHLQPAPISLAGKRGR